MAVPSAPDIRGLTVRVLGVDALRGGERLGGALLVDGLDAELVVFAGHQTVDGQLGGRAVRLAGLHPPA